MGIYTPGGPGTEPELERGNGAGRLEEEVEWPGMAVEEGVVALWLTGGGSGGPERIPRVLLVLIVAVPGGGKGG